MYATQLKIFSVAFFSGCRPLLSGLLSENMGHVTGLFGRGSGIALVVGPPDAPLPAPGAELQAASSEPAPPAPSMTPLAVALCRKKLRRETPRVGGVPSAFQPSLGCMAANPSLRWPGATGALRRRKDRHPASLPRRIERPFNYS